MEKIKSQTVLLTLNTQLGEIAPEHERYYSN